MTCISVYCGPELEFEPGRTLLWVDFLKDDVRAVFKGYLEDARVKKARPVPQLLICRRDIKIGYY